MRTGAEKEVNPYLLRAEKGNRKHIREERLGIENKSLTERKFGYIKIKPTKIKGANYRKVKQKR